ncbi:hypothetical protein SDC9_186416 [bioreactor metagenome]|uniref:WxL domain-containing protein n=1 Tax=bioreactor metagenome TaxID=1076179 RepID=A0A645HIP7_9ZZZZ
MKKQLIGLLAFSTLGLLATSIEGYAAENKQYDSTGLVEFIPNLDPTVPVDPENPDPEKPVNPIDPTDPNGPNPGTQGPLSIDYASSLDFGKNRISNKIKFTLPEHKLIKVTKKIRRTLFRFLTIAEQTVVGR